MMRHTDSQYETELATLTRSTYAMGLRAEQMVQNAVRALVERDGGLARSVVQSDDALDADEMEIDRQCLHLLVRRAPVGEDLRLVVAVLKLVTDLERVGDLAVNISERALDLMQKPGFGPTPEMHDLAERACKILNVSNRAFRDRDCAAARGLFDLDREIDDLNRRAFAQLLQLAESHSHDITRILSLSNVCKHLERVGDHAVNIGERVVYLVEGEDLRHGQGAPD